MVTIATILLLIGIWLVLDALAGIWRTRNLFFAWQLVGVSLIRIPLETFVYSGLETVPLWSLLLGLLGTFGLLIGLVAAIISLLTEANAIADYVRVKQNRRLLDRLLCIYPARVEAKMPMPRSR